MSKAMALCFCLSFLRFLLLRIVPVLQKSIRSCISFSYANFVLNNLALKLVLSKTWNTLNVTNVVTH